MKKLSAFIFFLTLLMITSGDLFSSSPRMVLVEEVTSGNCGACAGANNIFNPYMEGAQDIAIGIVYHSGNGGPEPLYDHNTSILGPRIWGTYVSGTLGTPAFWVNGTKVGVYDVQWEVQKYKGQSSPITMYVIEERSGDQVNVSIIVETDEAISGDKRLFLVVNEEYIEVHPPLNNGESDFYWTARKMMPGPGPTQGFEVNLEAGEVYTYTQTFTMHPDWDPEEIYCVAFIQDMADKDKEVLQAARSIDPSLANPEIALDYTKLDFDKVEEEKTMTLEIKNTGLASLDITEMIITEDDDAVFELVNGGPMTLGPYQKLDLQVKFTPNMTEYYNAVLEIRSNATNGTLKKVQLTGIGYNVVPKPGMLLSAESIDFGSVSEESTETLTITNDGYGTLEISAIEIENDNKQVFTVEFYGPLSIEPDGTHDVTLTFAPNENINYTADLKLTTNVEGKESVTVPVSGAGEAVATVAMITASEESLDFGEVSTDKTMTIKITNGGYKTLIISELNFIDDEDGVFEILNETIPELGFEEDFDLEVKFTPADNENYTATLKLISNADNNAELDIPVSGVGSGIVSVLELNNGAGSLLTMEAGPNPFEGSTVINYTIGGKLSRNIEIALFDDTGRKLQVLDKAFRTPGEYRIDLSSSDLSTGVYYLVATVDGQSGMMTLSVVK